MRRFERWMLACGLALMLAGVMIFGFLLAEKGFDLQRFAAAVSDEEYLRQTYEPGADFTRIEISTAGADVTLLPGREESCRVICDETASSGYDVQVRGDTLYITHRQEAEMPLRWINVNLHTPAIEVHLPETAYDAVKIGTAGGDITLQDLGIASLEISAASGDADLRRLQLGGGNLRTASGDVRFLNVETENEISIRTASGDVHLEDCDASAFTLSTASGDIFASLRSGKAFDVKTTSGDVVYPDGLPENGAFRADTVSGDVHVQVPAEP